MAAGPESLRHVLEVHDHLLVAVNELNSPSNIDLFARFLRDGKRVFLDSGVYNLATAHAQAHGITMDEALSTPPDHIDGFDALFERYVGLVRQFEADLWGYIEIDLGGCDRKIETRAQLEGLGLRPIPVYHPFNDGWDYFDYLAERYDRICFGNLVMARPAVRLRLMATLWERRRRYPHLWVHLLGVTPDTAFNAYPPSSSDSSSWLSGVRWTDSFRERAMGGTVGYFGERFAYRIGADPESEAGHMKARRLAGYWAHMLERNWTNHLQALAGAGLEALPHD